MTREEAKLVLDSLSTWIRQERLITEEIVEAIKTLSQPSLPSNLDETAEEVMPISYGSLEVDCYGGSEPVYSREQMKEMFKAGAEWMAGQGINLPAHIFIPSGFKPIYDYLKGEYPAAVHLDCGGSLILEKQLQNFNHNEEVIVQIRKE